MRQGLLHVPFALRSAAGASRRVILPVRRNLGGGGRSCLSNFLLHWFFFCLNYFRISETEGKVAIDYHTIDKEQPKDLTLLQRLLVFKRRGRTPDPIPERTWLEG